MKNDLPAQPQLHAAADGVLSIVINPGSGEHDSAQTRGLLASVFEAAGRPHVFVPVASAAQLADASRKAAADAAASGGVLVAVGGDGTINAVAQAAWEAGCALAIVPQGTFNLFGRAHGIAQDAQAAASALLRGRVQAVQVGEVNGRLFLVNASMGLYPQLLQDREAFKHQFGRRRWVAILAGLVTVIEWRRQMRLEIELDGVRTELVTPTLFVGNNQLQLDRIGIEAEITGRVGRDRLAGVATHPVGAWQMLGLALRGAIGRLGDAQQVRSFAFRSLTVRAPGSRRLKVATDGEVGVMTPPITFSVSPRPLQLVLPMPEDSVAVE